MATALYRRYRPETFSEMIGQAHVTEPLMTALRSERIGHAYLFSGPRGCGKTTSARVLARCLNCAQGPTDTPCGTCPSCIDLSRNGGGSLDVVEIDAASHGGVDDARELRERAVFAPARDRYKIFIIDEAHMVTAAGFNALLKIVEEPPPHVKFIFATTEPEKVIGTIRSRTHHYPFRLIAPGALIDYAQSLCASEGVTTEEGVLPLVVRAGGGSVRDTLSILDQLIAGSEGPQVTTARAAGLLGFTSTELIDEVVTALAAGEPAVAFTAVDRVVQTGQDPRRFVEDLLERLRDLIVIGATSVDGAAGVFRGVPETQLNRMFQQALLFPRGELSRLADIVSGALDSMAGATAPRLQLELMIARALVGAPSAASPREGANHRAAGANPGAAAAPATAVQPQAGGSFSEQLAAARVATTPSAPSTPAPPAPAPPAPNVVTPAPAVPNLPAAAQAPAAAPTSQPTPVQELASNAPATTTPVSPVPVNSSEPPPVSHSGLTPPLPETPVYQPGQSPADFVNAMRSARDFLKNDSAGAANTAPPAPAHAPAPAPAPAPAHPAAAAEPSSSVEPVAERPQSHNMTEVSDQASVSEPQATTPAAPVEPPRVTVAEVTVTLADLAEVWGDILEELRETDQAAWAAITRVQPLDLTNDVLTVGLSSSEDLNRFKSDGAGPLREAIDGALGFQVKYVPKHVPATAGDARAPRTGAKPTGSYTAEQSLDRTTEPAEDPDPAPRPQTHQPENPAPQSYSAAPQTATPNETLSEAPQNAPQVDPLEQRLGRVLGGFAAASVTRQETRAPASPPTAVSPDHSDATKHTAPNVNPAPEAVRTTHTAVARDTPQTAAPAPPEYAPYAEPPEDPEAFPPEDPYAPAPTPDHSAPFTAAPNNAVGDNGAIDNGAIDDDAQLHPASPQAAAATTGRSAPHLPQSGETATTQPTAPPTGPATTEETNRPPTAPPTIRAAAPSSPSFVRYGEAVVREVLGARFIEERPLNTHTDPSER